MPATPFFVPLVLGALLDEPVRNSAQNVSRRGNIYFGQSTCPLEFLEENSEVRILDSLFMETGGRYWLKAHNNWTKAGIPICNREGILCGWNPANMNSGVTEIRLDGFGLKGSLPTDVFQLPLLRRLMVSNNETCKEIGDNFVDKYAYKVLAQLQLIYFFIGKCGIK